MFYLGRYYNNALLAVESNGCGIATLQRLKDMEYINLYHQTKINRLTKEEGEVPGFKTTLTSKGTIIGNLKNAIDHEEIGVPAVSVLQELKDYIVTDSGKTEAAPGCHDDSVMALAIGLEVLRTHWDKIVTTNIPWREKAGTVKIDQTSWF